MEKMCTSNCALPMSQNCVFIWFHAIYTVKYNNPHFRIPFPFSEIVIYWHKSIDVEWVKNVTHVAPSAGFVKNYFLEKMCTSICALLSRQNCVFIQFPATYTFNYVNPYFRISFSFSESVIYWEKTMLNGSKSSQAWRHIFIILTKKWNKYKRIVILANLTHSLKPPIIVPRTRSLSK